MKTYDDIAACASAYAEARDNLNEDDFTSNVAVLRARVGLAECLIDAGWRPGDDSLALLRLDQQLLGQHHGDCEQRQQDQDAAEGP